MSMDEVTLNRPEVVDSVGSLPDSFAVPSAIGNVNLSLCCDINTSFALILRGCLLSKFFPRSTHIEWNIPGKTFLQN